MTTTTKLQDLKDYLRTLENRIYNFELDPDDYIDSYNELLDEEDVEICGMSYSTSHVLKEVDPTAYRCGLIDYIDGIDVEENEEYIELVEEKENLEFEIEELALVNRETYYKEYLEKACHLTKDQIKLISKGMMQY